MTKIILHLAKAAVTTITSLLFFSCGLGSLQQIDGSGEVVTKARPSQEEFTSITAEQGIEIVIVQGDVRSVMVEADSNFHEHIKTEIKNGELDITSDANLRNGTARVSVTLPKLEKAEVSSSATIKSKGTITGESISLTAGSGSSIDISVNTTELFCEADSGGRVKVSGKTEELQADAGSGGHIDAKGLIAQSVEAESSNGGHTYVTPVESLSAEASSGGHVYYTNTPNELDKKTSSGGEVKQE